MSSALSKNKFNTRQMPPPRPFTSLDIVHCSLYYYFFLTNTKMAKKTLLRRSFILWFAFCWERWLTPADMYVWWKEREEQKCLFSRVNWSKLNDLGTKRGHSWTMSDVIFLCRSLGIVVAVSRASKSSKLTQRILFV